MRLLHLFIPCFEMKTGRKYQTLLVIVAGLLVIGYLKRADAFLYTAIGVAVFGALISPFATAIDWIWYKLAAVLGRIMSFVILSVFFLLVLAPFAMLKRIFAGSDAMHERKPVASTWRDRNHTFTPKDIENPW